MSENILVVPSSIVQELEIAHGFSWRPARAASRLQFDNRAKFMPRTEELETDPSYKQLIPYLVLTHRDVITAGPMRIFNYYRAGGGEGRLRGRRSVGVGGHVNDGDGSTVTAVERGLIRELHEELLLSASDYEVSFAGFLNDDTTPVGLVHLGLVYHVSLNSPNVQVREHAALCDAGFHLLPELEADLTSFEMWSQMLLTNMFEHKD